MKLTLLALAAAPLAVLSLDCESGLSAAKVELALLQDEIKELNGHVKTTKATVNRWKKAVKKGVYYDAEGNVVGECASEEEVVDPEGEEEFDCEGAAKAIKQAENSIKTMSKEAAKNKYTKACSVAEEDRTAKQTKNCELYHNLTQVWIPDTESYVAFLTETC